MTESPFKVAINELRFLKAKAQGLVQDFDRLEALMNEIDPATLLVEAAAAGPELEEDHPAHQRWEMWHFSITANAGYPTGDQKFDSWLAYKAGHEQLAKQLEDAGIKVRKEGIYYPGGTHYIEGT